MTELAYECFPLGDSAIVIRLGSDISLMNLHKVSQVGQYLENNWKCGFVELVAAYTTITIHYDAFQLTNYASEDVLKSGCGGRTATWLPYDEVLQYVEKLLDAYDEWDGFGDGQRIEQRRGKGLGEGYDRGQGQGQLGEIVEIPVCYGGDFGPDLAEVANFHGVNPSEIVQRHSEGVYPVYMIGFAPGFPYLGGLSEGLATPRKSVPRTRIPVGSVAIGGAQTGIYPMETPGGWQLIGRTPLRLFCPEMDPPSLLKVGDQVRFVPITPEQFHEQEERYMRHGL